MSNFPINLLNPSRYLTSRFLASAEIRFLGKPNYVWVDASIARFGSSFAAHHSKLPMGILDHRVSNDTVAGISRGSAR